MGGGYSQRYLEFTLNDSVDGQGPEVQHTFNVLRISPQDVNKYWTCFNALNFDGGGLVTMERFHAFYKLEPTDFTEKVFAVMDIDHSGKLNFNEYVVSTWNYLSSDMDILAAFAFSLFDLDDSKTLEVNEVHNMVREVYGGDMSRVGNVLTKLNDVRNEDGQIGRVEFCIFSRRYPLLLFPAFAMQQALRRNILGEDYWDKMTELRNSLFFGKTLFDIIESNRPATPPPAAPAAPSPMPKPKPKPKPKPDKSRSRKASVVDLVALR